MHLPSRLLLAAAAASLNFVAAAHATVQVPSALTPGDLLVYRVGDGSTGLSNTGNLVYIDEWTPTGTYVASYDTGIYASGTATSEGELSVSPDGRYYGFTGYASASTSGSLANTSASAVNRAVGLLGVDGTVSTQNLASFASGNNIRAAATTDGTQVWVAGATGAGYATMGNSGVVSLSSANVRDLGIFGGQLYVSGAASSLRGVAALGGSPLPTTGSQSLNPLSGADAGSSGSAYSFVLADLNAAIAGYDTIYVADDASAGGIEKYSLVNGAWTLNGTIAAAAVRGLTAVVQADGSVELFGSTGGSTGTGSGAVYSFLDTSGYNAAVSGSAGTLFTNASLANAIGGSSSNYVFRGVEVVIPEPAACAALIGLAALGVAFWRRR